MGITKQQKLNVFHLRTMKTTAMTIIVIIMVPVTMDSPIIIAIASVVGKAKIVK